MTLGETINKYHGDSPMTTEDRIARIDTLLCILFGGLTAHPLANTLIPPAELEQLRALLPQETMTVE